MVFAALWLASELGILSPLSPRLITTLKTDPPGTNGAMSVDGTVASITSGGIVDVLMGGAGSEKRPVDSFLGETVQQTPRYSTKSTFVLQDAIKATSLEALSTSKILPGGHCVMGGGPPYIEWNPELNALYKDNLIVLSTISQETEL
ncbi:hypothetical protein JR316_0012484 [Psilocybe cubensis]|nr:hypothetical protein JR316_0012484 [Psilocybe cubensis]KAH9475373.1 hypothetical protein JR316_0012484 [Psilocybe cubensis]